MTSHSKKIRFVFFGTSDFAVDVLEALKTHSLVPALILTQEDKPQGRGLEVQPPKVKVWAGAHGVAVFQPASLRSPDVLERLKSERADVFVVAAYGKLIPKDIFELPPHMTLNVHPSLLPKLRGPSPIQTAILTEKETGTSIMLISEKMDEGPILAQEEVPLPEWPVRSDLLEKILAKHSGELLAQVLPEWIEGRITPTPQDELQATYTKKIEKEDGYVDLSDDPTGNLRKVYALGANPGTYTTLERKNGKKVRVKIKDAEIVDGIFTPTLVVPEGKHEMSWQDFLRGNS